MLLRRIVVSGLPDLAEKPPETLFDPLFSPKFFEYKDVTTDLKVNFPLPSSVDAMQSFLASKDGEDFRAGLSAQVTRLQDWMNSHGLEALSGNCDHFRRIYTRYEGTDPELNKIYYALYRQGMPHLAGICDLLESNKIPPGVAQDIVKNLITGMRVCPPGAYTNIVDAYWKLASWLNLPIDLMATRRHIVQQIVLEALRDLISKANIPDNAMVGMEIHYVNAVVNKFAGALAVKVTDDEYTNICDPIIQIFLIASLISVYKRKLSLENVLEKIIYERDLDNLLKSNLAYAKVESFEQGLDRYGEDRNYSINDLVELQEDEVSHKPRWSANYFMYLTMLNRFAQKGNVILDGKLKDHSLDEDTSIQYLPHNRLTLAFVRTSGRQVPLIPFVVEILNRGAPDKVVEIMNFLQINMEDFQRFDIVEGMLTFLKHHPELIVKHGWMEQWIGYIIDLLPDGYRFDHVLQLLPQQGHQPYLHMLGRNKIIQLIEEGDQLTNVLEIFSDEAEARAFLYEHIGKDRFPSLITSSKQLAKVLKVLPVKEWGRCIEDIGANWQELTKEIRLDRNLLSVILCRLPELQWEDFFRKYFQKSWWSCIKDMEQVTAVLRELDPKKWPAFHNRVNSSDLLRLMKRHGVYNMDELLELLQALPPDRFKLFMDIYRELLLDTVGKSPALLGEFLEHLPKAKSQQLLDVLGKEKIVKMMIWSERDDEFHHALAKLSDEQSAFFLNYLGSENVCRIMREHVSLWHGMLEKLSGSKFTHFLDLIGTRQLDDLFPRFKDLVCVLNHHPMQDGNVQQLLAHLSVPRIEVLRNQFIEAVMTTVFSRNNRYVSTPEEIQAATVKIYREFIPEKMPANPESKLFSALGIPKEGCIFGWFLLRNIIDTRGMEKRLFKDFEPQRALAMMLDQLEVTFRLLSRDQCIFLFRMLNEKNYLMLLDKLMQLVTKQQSLQLVDKLDEQSVRKLITRMPPSVDMAALIGDRNQLIAVLKYTPVELHLPILDKIGEEKLCRIMLDKHSVKEDLEAVRNEKLDKSVRDVFLLALLRARRYQSQKTPDKAGLSILPFRKAAHESPAAFALMEEALVKSIREGHQSGLTFFKDVKQGEQKAAAENAKEGELGKIRRAYLD